MSNSVAQFADIKRSNWLGIAVGSLVHLGLKAVLPAFVLAGFGLLSMAMDIPFIWLDNVDDTRYPPWIALQAAIFVGSILAGGLATFLAPRKSLAVPAALVILSLLTSAFEQFPRYGSSSAMLIWQGGPCIGLVLGVLFARRLAKRKLERERQLPEHVAEELAAREPIFHRPEFGTNRPDFEKMMAEDFWEVGASGQKYSRDLVLSTLEQRHASTVTENFSVTDFACRLIAADTCLVTYRLEQDGGRLSRRSTLWRAEPSGWKIIYHQGTLISDPV